MNALLRSCLYSLPMGFAALTHAACSSSPGDQSVPDSGGSSGGSSGSGAVDGGTPGDGGACPAPTMAVTTATKISTKISWIASLADLPNPDGLDLTIWLMTTYTQDATNHLTGTTRTCGNVTPTISLTLAGSQSIGMAT